VAKVEAIASADWPTKAMRPRNSVLDSSKFERDFKIRLPDWRQSVGKVVERLAEAR
jgi:dTDP-4-dehydrorhamnose reductase